jgi:glycosyltransferase involved in cell wall biosynthesis
VTQLRIAIVAPCWFAVPPVRYGGIEWIVALLADGLADAGHDVTLFASGGSTTGARLVSTYDEPPSMRIGTTMPELSHTLTAYTRASEFDVLNDHSGLLAAAMARTVSPVPICHTIHGPLVGEPGEVYRKIAQLNPELTFISLSHNQRLPLPDIPWLANCPNALDLNLYPYQEAKRDYLLFLGRLSPEKGAARAAQIARRAGLPLRIAGKMHDAQERAYFSSEIEPLLGPDVEYLGEVSHDEKTDLLRHARATLFPISWEEPFGLVMIESMACGTPVIATRFGAVPEVIADGVGGRICDDEDQMVAALERLDELEPAAIRRSVEERFSPARMVDDYVDAYERLLLPRPSRRPRPVEV